MYYGIGLDIGIASVGYAVMLLNGNNEPMRILKMGARVFEEAENPKDGSSLAAPRREFRGARRRLRRLTHRKERVRSQIKRHFDVDDDYISKIYEFRNNLIDIYEIRYMALDKKLGKDDFIRLLIHLSQRRGFKSNRKIDAEDKKNDEGKLLTAVNENERLMNEKGYRTIGEMLYLDKKFSHAKRNTKNSYQNTISRKNYSDEIDFIFERQREFNNPYASEELQNKFKDIMLSQRSFEEGPGGNSPYGGNQIEKMLGKCTLEQDEFRAVKASYSFEYFNLLSKVNALRIATRFSTRQLTTQERQTVINLAFKTKELKYSAIRKSLTDMTEDDRFNISYGTKSAEEVEKSTKFSYLRAYHDFKKQFGDEYRDWPRSKMNDLAYALTVYKNDSGIREYLINKGFSDEEIGNALKLPAQRKTCNLSIKALNKIIPYLEEGLLYNEACDKAGYNFKADNKNTQKFLPANPDKAPELQDITNPVVRRSVSQTIKVVNAIIREMNDSPVYINIELARELSKNYNDRKKIEKSQNDNRKNNETLMEELRNNFNISSPTGLDLVKLKLWKEQDGKCPYSQKSIDYSRLLEDGYVDIDHIIPYSISFDDTYNNKVLVFSYENRQKGNRIPMEYLSGERKDNFEIWIDNSNLRNAKKKNLLKENLTDDDLSGFKKRNLQDTQYIASFILKFINKYLEFNSSNTEMKKRVTAVNGAATSYIRKRWGISKIREDGDTHHAVDAAVIAATTNGMIKRISDYSRFKESGNYLEITADDGKMYDMDKRTGEIVNRFPLPYSDFRRELTVLTSENPTQMLQGCPLVNYSANEELKPIFVSRMPNHKAKGSAHLATIRKPYNDNGTNCTISKIPLQNLKLDKNGEIENYFNPDSDRLLYNALLKRLKEYNGDAKKAFEGPFHKPKSDGTDGPIVKKVKIMEKATLTVSVHDKTAVADNGTMVRIDVFYIAGEGYYAVPIYVTDTVEEKLPNKAIVANKSYSEWKVMDEKDFVFSLYKNDLIKVTFKKEKDFKVVNNVSTLAPIKAIKSDFVYYRGTDISTASIKVINHDKTYQLRGLGIKTLLSIEKYNVDVLGNISKAGKEERMGFK